MKTIIKKQDIKKQIENLPTAWHNRHYGLNVKVYNFKDPIRKFLQDALTPGLYEENIIYLIFEETRGEFKERTGRYLCTEGRFQGYWGFITNEYTTTQDLNETIKQLRISLTNSLYKIFNNETYFIERGVFFYDDGTDINLNVGIKNLKYVIEMWGAKALEEREKEFEKKLNENFGPAVQELLAFWEDFETAYRMKDFICMPNA